MNCQTLMNPMMNLYTQSSPSSSSSLPLSSAGHGALGEQAMCGVQDDGDNAPDPSHVPMARDDTSGREEWRTTQAK